MSSRTFQFSPAALLYCENVAVVDEIKKATTAKARKLYKAHQTLVSEMRAEAYENIAAFGDVLLEELSAQPWEREGRRLCGQTTYTVKSWRGHKINYRWLRPIAEECKIKPRVDGGYIALSFPVPNIVKELDDDTHLHSYFQLMTKQNLGVGLVCETSETDRRRIAALARNEALGLFGDTNSKVTWTNMRIPFDASDPFTSVIKRITALLRAIYEIDFPGRGNMSGDAQGDQNAHSDS